MEENILPTEAELAAENSALVEPKEDEIRQNIISELGLDEIDDAERIDKLVAKEVKHRKDLSQAIGQKIKYRGMVKPVSLTEPEKKGEDLEKILSARDQALLDKITLKQLNLPDEIKTEVQKLAKAQGISVEEAAKDSYIQFKLDNLKKTDAEIEASASRTPKTGQVETSFDNPPEVDMSTEEGRKKWDEYLADQRKKNPPEVS